MLEYGCFHTKAVIELLVRQADVALLRSCLIRLGFAAVEETKEALVDRYSPIRCQLFVSSPDTPDPARDAVRVSGITVLRLEQLIQWQLQVAMVNRRRSLHYRVDVQELIEALALPKAFAESLDPSLRETFLDLHRIVTEVADPHSERR